jgi:hypothetical protein
VIVGGRAGTRLVPRAAALALVLGAAVSASVGASAGASGAPAESAGTGSGGWAPAWSWRSGSGGLPKGCAPYAGRTSAGMRWSPSLVRIVHGRLQLATAGRTAQGDPAGSGIGCTERAQRYGRLEVRARLPKGRGLVGRIALWPSTTSGGSDWSGLTVPSADVSPAYATNGCGDEAYGAAVPARLAGAFHDYLITWSPHGFSVAVDGRTLYRDDKAFDRPRWLGISLSTTGQAASSARLLVEKVVAFRWTGPLPPAGRTADADAVAPVPGSQDSPDAVSSAQDATAHAGSAGPGGTAAGGSTAGGPRARAPGTAALAAGDEAFGPVLEGTPLSAPWLIGGGCVAVGVLVGVVRAARAARRRPLVPR